MPKKLEFGLRVVRCAVTKRQAPRQRHHNYDVLKAGNGLVIMLFDRDPSNRATGVVFNILCSCSLLANVSEGPVMATSADTDVYARAVRGQTVFCIRSCLARVSKRSIMTMSITVSWGEEGWVVGGVGVGAQQRSSHCLVL